MQGDLEKCIAAGMDDYLSKPVKSRELHKMLMRYVKPYSSTSSLVTSQSAAKACYLPRNEEQISMSNDEVISSKTLDNMPNYLESLRQAIDSSDGEKLYNAAHKFKGSCTNLGAVSMVTLCQRLETLGRAGDIQQAALIVTHEMENEGQRLQRALEQEKQRGRTFF